MGKRSTAFLLFLSSLVFNQGSRAEDKLGSCALLEKTEVQEVQGVSVTETKSSRAGTRLAITQCFYVAATFEKSVSLEVTRRNTKSSLAPEPRQEWRRLFHPGDPEPEEKAASGASRTAFRPPEEKEGAKPLRVEGLGDEAFWVGNRLVGALYVLKGDAYFRLSLGGWADESTRMGKSQALAQEVLKRF